MILLANSREVKAEAEVKAFVEARSGLVFLGLLAPMDLLWVTRHQHFLSDKNRNISALGSSLTKEQFHWCKRWHSGEKEWTFRSSDYHPLLTLVFALNSRLSVSIKSPKTSQYARLAYWQTRVEAPWMQKYRIHIAKSDMVNIKWMSTMHAVCPCWLYK